MAIKKYTFTHKVYGAVNWSVRHSSARRLQLAKLVIVNFLHVEFLRSPNDLITIPGRCTPKEVI